MSKIAPKLSQMPWNIKEKMIHFLETEEKLSLRQCSKNFQLHVNRSPIYFKTLNFTINLKEITVKLDICEGKSVQKIFGYLTNGVRMENPSENWTGYRIGGDYRKAAVEQLLKVFKTFPNARVGHLRFQIGEDDLFGAFYRSLTEHGIHFPLRWPEDRQVIFGEMHGNKLKVESFSWHEEMNQEEVLSVLELCEPGTLRSMLCVNNPIMGFSPIVQMNRIVETEQWKRAKEASIGNGECAADLEHWKHLDVTFLNRPSFEVCRLLGNDFDLTGVDKYLEPLDKRMCPRAYHHFTIASPLDRNARFRATVSKHFILLEKYTN